MLTVLNKEQSDWRELADAALVDRTTVFGNPFIIGRDGTRDEVIRKYIKWIMTPEQRELRVRIRRELRGKNLICHCAPQLCHAEVILVIANTRGFSKQMLILERRYGAAA